MPGPNAPLGDLCNTSSQPHYNAEAAISQWTGAGFPAGQLLLGVPFYGYVSDSTKTSLTDGALQHTSGAAVLGLAGKSAEAAGMPADLDEGSAAGLAPLEGAHPVTQQPPAQGLVPLAGGNGNLSAYWGTEITFSGLIAEGALQETSTPGTFIAVNGYTYGLSYPRSFLCTM